MGLLGPSLPLFSAPFVAIGNNTGVFVNGFTTLAYESNLFKVNETAATATAPAVSATSAWSFNFSPGVEVELADTQTLTSRIFARGEIIRFFDEDNLDGEYPHLLAITTYNGGSIEFRSQFSLDKTAGNSADVRADGFLVKNTRYAGNALVKYKFSEITALQFGLDFASLDFTNNAAFGNDYVSLPFRLFYNISEKVALTTGYQFRNTAVTDEPISAATEFRDHNFTVGATGMFTPLLTGDVQFGYQQRDVRSANPTDFGKLSIRSNLVYAIPEYQASVALAVNKDFSTSIAAQTVDRTTISARGTYQVDDRWSFLLVGSYAPSRYQNLNREEDLFSISFGATYAPNEYFSVDANIGRLNIDGSGDLASNFDNNTFSLTGRLRY
jgi:hypothetical protein